MKRFTLSLLASLLLAQGPGACAAPHLGQRQDGPRIEVLFVLDTTGSMGGLIEGAKQKIWSIATQMLQASPRPRLRVGLLGYRDRGDVYITRFSDLTEDLDAVSAQLQQFQAMGGGDTPESVNQALAEAVARPTWSADQNVLKLVFLVGDAPPHMDYQDDVKYPVSMRRAVARGLIINTVQCGQLAETTPFWRDIAAQGGGAFLTTGQTGDMQAISTPLDAELVKLNTEVGATLVPYGLERERTAAKAKQMASETLAACAPAAAADRLAYNRASGKVVQGGGDLLDAMVSGGVSMETLDPASLPPEMKGMTAAERKAWLQKKQEARRKLQARIDELTAQRKVLVDKENARRLKEGKGDAFDVKVVQTLREEARAKGIKY